MTKNIFCISKFKFAEEIAIIMTLVSEKKLLNKSEKGKHSNQSVIKYTYTTHEHLCLI